jgi:hypothetical protein
MGTAQVRQLRIRCSEQNRRKAVTQSHGDYSDFGRQVRPAASDSIHIFEFLAAWSLIDAGDASAARRRTVRAIDSGT